jgi:peroxiredoxin
MLVDDGTVSQLIVESAPGQAVESSAEGLLATL